MLGGYHRRRRGGYGWGGGGVYTGGYGIAPAYAVLPDASDCACKGEGGAVAGLESWVKQNPIIALIGVFALGYVVSKKKGLF